MHSNAIMPVADAWVDRGVVVLWVLLFSVALARSCASARNPGACEMAGMNMFRCGTPCRSVTWNDMRFSVRICSGIEERLLRLFWSRG